MAKKGEKGESRVKDGQENSKTLRKQKKKGKLKDGTHCYMSVKLFGRNFFMNYN